MEKQTLLLHTCCAPCVVYVSRQLNDNYDVQVYFYNPNIHPVEEYERRRDELIKYAEQVELDVKVEPADFDGWYKYIKGLEKEPEGSLRCWKCFEMRLEKTAQYAKDNNYEIFTTVLSVSPHKNAEKINEIGTKIAEKYGVKFLEANFKKQDGFKKSAELSKKYNLYRQSYCGCEFSMNKHQLIKE